MSAPIAHILNAQFAAAHRKIEATTMQEPSLRQCSARSEGAQPFASNQKTLDSGVYTLILVPVIFPSR